MMMRKGLSTFRWKLYNLETFRNMEAVRISKSLLHAHFVARGFTPASNLEVSGSDLLPWPGQGTKIMRWQITKSTFVSKFVLISFWLSFWIRFLFQCLPSIPPNRQSTPAQLISALYRYRLSIFWLVFSAAILRCKLQFNPSDLLTARSLRHFFPGSC